MVFASSSQKIKSAFDSSTPIQASSKEDLDPNESGYCHFIVAPRQLMGLIQLRENFRNSFAHISYSIPFYGSLSNTLNIQLSPAMSAFMFRAINKKLDFVPCSKVALTC